MACNIAIGEVSTNVSQLQMFLQAVGLYTCCKVDGQYGGYTKEAVRLYQRRHGLVQDGWAGCITTGHMELECANHNCNAPAPQPSPSVGGEYLQPTLNCQSDNPSIIQMAKQLTSGISDQYGKANAIYNFVRDAIGYAFYYNTRYGAVGTLNSRTGNCTDMAHLMNALCRAAGIPARYWNMKARFASGTYGHVVSEVFVNGRWFIADASNDGNTFGQVKWTLVADYGHFSSISF